jgi:hypothetical protein
MERMVASGGRLPDTLSDDIYPITKAQLVAVAVAEGGGRSLRRSPGRAFACAALGQRDGVEPSTCA